MDKSGSEKIIIVETERQKLLCKVSTTTSKFSWQNMQACDNTLPLSLRFLGSLLAMIFICSFATTGRRRQTKREDRWLGQTPRGEGISFQKFKISCKLCRLVFSHVISAALFFNQNKRESLHINRTQFPKDWSVWDPNLAAVSLFRVTNMAVVTSCENQELISF